MSSLLPPLSRLPLALASLLLPLAGCPEEDDAEWQPATETLLIAECSADAALEPLVAKIEDDIVKARVRPGGCGHQFRVCWDHSFLESNPVQARLAIEVETSDPGCDAIFTYDLEIDLAPVREQFTESYNSATGTVLVDVGSDLPAMAYTF